MKEKSIVGDLINFRGLVYNPLNENGVIFLFGKVMEDLNMYIEEIKPGFPDCIGRRFTGRGWEKVYIEFEFKSSNFKDHGHNPRKCDIIVCWEHDWLECPLEVIELKDVIKALPNKHIRRPTEEVEEETGEEPIEGEEIEDSNEEEPPKIDLKDLLESFDKKVKKIDDKIWSKMGKIHVSYYSPERVFIYTIPQADKITLWIFVGNGNIPGVDKKLKAKAMKEKWGVITLRNEEELPEVIKAVERSYELIKKAIKNNESSYS